MIDLALYIAFGLSLILVIKPECFEFLLRPIRTKYLRPEISIVEMLLIISISYMIANSIMN